MHGNEGSGSHSGTAFSATWNGTSARKPRYSNGWASLNAEERNVPFNGECMNAISRKNAKCDIGNAISAVHVAPGSHIVVLIARDLHCVVQGCAKTIRALYHKRIVGRSYYCMCNAKACI